jgi:hypothetical protein
LGWVAECMAAGVDGMDIRISNHSTWSDHMALYGFNEPVVEEYERRYRTNPNREPYDPELLADLRGEFFDQFLTRAKKKLAAAGKKLQLHLEVESFRPDAIQLRERTRPGNTTFHWRRWIDSGLADEAILMTVAWAPQRALTDSLAQEMIAKCNSNSIPLYLRNFIWNSRDGKANADQIEYAFRHGGLSGFNFYETASFYDQNESAKQGKLIFFPGLVEGIRSRVEKLGLL